MYKTIYTIFSSLKKQYGPETVECNEKGRPVRKTTKKQVNYDLMIASEKDLEETGKKKKRKNIEKEEAELESWIQAIVDANTKDEYVSTVLLLGVKQN